MRPKRMVGANGDVCKSEHIGATSMIHLGKSRPQHPGSVADGLIPGPIRHGGRCLALSGAVWRYLSLYGAVWAPSVPVSPSLLLSLLETSPLHIGLWVGRTDFACHIIRFFGRSRAGQENDDGLQPD